MYSRIPLSAESGVPRQPQSVSLNRNPARSSIRPGDAVRVIPRLQHGPTTGPGGLLWGQRDPLLDRQAEATPLAGGKGFTTAEMNIAGIGFTGGLAVNLGDTLFMFSRGTAD